MTEKTPLPELWRDLCRSQPWWTELLPSGSWFGFDPKTFPDRLQALFEAKSLATARSLLASLNKHELEYLERLAEVNRRQASLAARRTLVANITAPLALALGLAQIFPEAVDKLLEQPYGVAEASLVAALAAIFASVQHAQIRARQAEDLHDLITCRLSAARLEDAALTKAGNHKIESATVPTATVASP